VSKTFEEWFVAIGDALEEADKADGLFILFGEIERSIAYSQLRFPKEKV
jgi:hypothetical protein